MSRDILLSCLLGLLLAGTVSPDFPCLAWESWWFWGSMVVSRLSLIWGSCGGLFVFLMTRLVFKGSWEGRRPQKRNVILITTFQAAWCQHAHCRGCWLLILAEVVSVKIFFVSHSILCSLEEVSRCSPCLVGGESSFISLRGQYLHQLLTIFPYRDLSPSFCCLFNHLFASIQTHRYLFYPLSCYQICYFFLFTLFLPLTLGWVSFSSFCGPLMWPHPFVLEAHFLPSFPASKMLQAPPPG